MLITSPEEAGINDPWEQEGAWSGNVGDQGLMGRGRGYEAVGVVKTAFTCN